MPNITWKIPARIPANRNPSNDPIVEIPERTIAVNPAAGPLTLNGDLLILPTTIPPMIPEIIPENSGAPEAKAIPRHKGTDIKKTTRPDNISDFKYACNFCIFILN